ncbi:serine/threonine-protein kinase [Segatella copri]|uniref:serine/threonine-protein kinase n=1 Tax=Segatella copri TaxID=165179 RepID=UPI001F3A1453|nr:serine/threonine-protein kinase [Segatella copri]
MKQLCNNAILCNGKYRIEKVLGQGGFGITYKAIMKETVSGSLSNMEVDVPVAIKEFFMKDTCEREEGTGKITVPSQGSRAVVELYRKKFVKEAKNLAQMNHPHIVKVVDVFEENDTVYYVMQYLSGGSLADYVKQHGALDEAIAIKYIQQIGSALEYMHQKHICHYDVKPSNILLDDKGGAILIDFGISKGYTEEGHQTSSTPVGISAGYAPLEQYQQNLQDFSPATDVYGLAATLYFLVTGKVPAEASIVLNDGIGRKSDGISAKLWRSVERGMCPRKNDRFQNISDFIGSISVGETTIVSKKTFVNEFEAPIASSTTNAIAGKGKGKWARTIFMSLLTISMLLSLIKVGYVKVLSIS